MKDEPAEAAPKPIPSVARDPVHWGEHTITQSGPDLALLASPDKQISLTDPDCRSMATSGRGFALGRSRFRVKAK